MSIEGGVRVKQLISQLNYLDLVSANIVPNINEFTPSLPSKRYPPWLYALSKTKPEIFGDFGLFVEEIIYQSFSSTSPLDYSAIWLSVCRSSPPPKLTSSNNYFKGILDTFRPMFQGHKVAHGECLSHSKGEKSIEGHPDFFCDTFGDQTWIIDVKTTTGFAKMAHATYLQILSYSALARAIGHTNNYIGILLPIQRKILWYDVSAWDSSKYLAILLRESKWVLDDVFVLHSNILGMVERFTSSSCGAHCQKDLLLDYAHKSNGRPLQFFLSNPRGKTVTIDTAITHLSHELPLNVTIFVHAPYIINLCNRDTDCWGVNHLRNELNTAQQLDIKGVVVHVGKSKQLPIRDALNMMEKSIREVLPEASVDCPLILETPAGQGTELCVPIEELMSFYQRFDKAENLKICVDSCHVFAAGYDPVWYLQEWLTHFPESVILMHFNDSEVPRGARTDRHAIPGLGYIGYGRMKQLHDLCVENQIPMIRE
jgi:deoxyribonuclease-4